MFFVIELQKNGSQVGNIVTAHQTQMDAESKYHTVLAAAALSTLDAHSAILLDEDATPMLYQCYRHGNAVEPVA